MFRQLAVQTIAVFTALCLVSCTSMRPIPAGEPQAVRQSVKVGDEVSVVASNGKTYLLVLTVVDDEKIVGTGDNKKVTIRYAQIVSMEVRRFSAAKTVGATGGTLVALYLLATAIATYLFFNALDESLKDDE